MVDHSYPDTAALDLPPERHRTDEQRKDIQRAWDIVGMVTDGHSLNSTEGHLAVLRGIQMGRQLSGVAQQPMQADIAQIVDRGWKAGKSSNDVAEEILREFDTSPVPSTDAQPAPVYLTEGQKQTLARIANARAAGVKLHQFWLDFEASLALPSTDRATLPGHDETMANLDALTISSTDKSGAA